MDVKENERSNWSGTFAASYIQPGEDTGGGSKHLSSKQRDVGHIIINIKDATSREIARYIIEDRKREITGYIITDS